MNNAASLACHIMVPTLKHKDAFLKQYMVL